MDPIAHTFTGAALGATGLRYASPLGMATLVLAANAPDVDVAMYAAGRYAALAFRRGWTHGLPAVVVLPVLVVGVVLAYDRWVRRRRDPAAPPARARPLLGLAALGVATHPTLDWLNNYGMRWLMPFDGRWSYGDALFIIDPWVWLALGGALFLCYSRDFAALAGWALFWGLATFLIVTTPVVPAGARIVWLVGVAALVAARIAGIGTGGVSGASGPGGVDAADAAVSADREVAETAGHLGNPGPARAGERTARWASGAVALYVAAMALADIPEQRAVRAALAARGIGDVEEVMVAPLPANPFGGLVLAATPGAYYPGTFDWLAEPRVRMEGDSLARRPAPAAMPAVRAASRTRDARHFLRWSRFPYFEVRETAEGYAVRILDARYAAWSGASGLGGLVVRLARSLEPIGGS